MMIQIKDSLFNILTIYRVRKVDELVKGKDRYYLRIYFDPNICEQYHFDNIEDRDKKFYEFLNADKNNKIRT